MKGKYYSPYESHGIIYFLELVGAWLLAILWALPILYAIWTAFHPLMYSTKFSLFAPITLENFKLAWEAAPFARYFINTVLLVTLVITSQLIFCTLAAFSFARFEFRGKEICFWIILIQLMIMPDVLIVENYKTISSMGLLDSILAIAFPYLATGFGIFWLRQAFKIVPKELDDAAAIEGANIFQILWYVYVPLAKPTYIAYALVSMSYQWNNFLWPLIVTNSVSSRTLTVGLQIFSSIEQGVNWSIIAAAVLITTTPLLLALLLFQKQFMQSFMRAGIK